MKQLNTKGIAHVAILLLVVIAVAAFGTYRLVASHAATCQTYTWSTGKTGTCVKNIQRITNAAGLNWHYSGSAVIAVDGKFGTKTKSQVTYFQKATNIAQDGIVGPQTWKKLCADAQMMGSANDGYKAAVSSGCVYSSAKPTPTPAPAPSPTPTPTPVTTSGAVYGTGVGYDTKANINVGPDGQKVAIRFKATTTSALNSVRWVQRGGPVYSNGNGGTTTLSVQADDGSGHPSGSSLASGSITTGNPSGNWETYTPVNMSPAPNLTAGKIYYIVFTNPSTTNNISVNSVYVYNHTTPRQFMFADSDYGIMETTGSWGGMDAGYTPVVDLAFANGIHDGSSYYEAMIANYATISGTSQMAREQFTVSGGNKTVTSASVRVRRTSGTSPLVMTLETSAGSAIESVSVPAANVPTSAPGGDTGGAVWVTAKFAASHVLSNGSSYHLKISTASGTSYTTFPVRAGTDKGFASYAFPDGTGQATTNGSSWTDMYAYSHEDMQFYFTL